MAYDPISIVSVVTAGVTEPLNDGTPGSALYRIPIRLSRAPSARWQRSFLLAWQFPPQFTSRHRPGIVSISGDLIYLDGTTIEELRDTHKATLQLCIAQANAIETKFTEHGS